LYSSTQGTRHASLTVTGLVGSTAEFCHGKLGYRKWERKENDDILKENPHVENTWKTA